MQHYGVSPIGHLVYKLLALSLGRSTSTPRLLASLGSLAATPDFLTTDVICRVMSICCPITGQHYSDVIVSLP
eukprot:26810-Eustigmatos_ZCMA.PRE.1